MIELDLYHRRGCHLCDDMRDALREFQTDLGFTLREHDIDRDAGLRARFHVLVPVLCLGEQEICRYHLDPAALRLALKQPPEPG